MSGLDRLEPMLEDLGQATAALENVCDRAQEVVDDPLVAQAHPMLLEAQQEAQTALRHARAALGHLERLKNPTKVAA